MILVLWSVIGILSGLLVATLLYVRDLQRTLTLRTHYLYALIGDRHEDILEEVASARESLGENLRWADELGFREWLDQEERRAN